MADSKEDTENAISDDTIKCKTKCTSEGFHNLPQKILVKIFSYCTEKEIASSLCRVCINWLVASRDSSLWKRLEFRGEHLQISNICRTLHRAPHLQTVSFICVPKVVVAIRQISRYSSGSNGLLIITGTTTTSGITTATFTTSTIATVNISGSIATAPITSSMATATTTSNSITTVTNTNTSSNIASATTIITSISYATTTINLLGGCKQVFHKFWIAERNKEVKNVVIRFCTSVDQCIPEASLRNLIICCPQLQVLDLKGTQFRAQWLYYELHKLKTLHHLNLGMNKYLRFQDLLMVVYNCRTLTELSLFQWGSQGTTQLGITDQDAVLIFDLLHKQLTSLKFDMQDLGPPAYKALECDCCFQAILECKKLERLALNNAHQMPDQVSCSLVIQLPNIEVLTFREANYFSTDNFCVLLSTPGLHLTKFDASGCWHMNDKCLEALASTCYKTLQRLSVKRCKLITENGIGYILHSCLNLTHLNAAHIGEMGPELLDKIPEHLPNLKILILDQKAEQQYRLLFHIASRFPQLQILQSSSEFLKAEHPYNPLH